MQTRYIAMDFEDIALAGAQGATRWSQPAVDAERGFVATFIRTELVQTAGERSRQAEGEGNGAEFIDPWLLQEGQPR
jgi:hypothetical protein